MNMNNSEGDSNIGRKLLEKYGWVSGKGLGKNEDGIVEPIKAKSQTENQGIGYTDPPEAWLQTSSDYAALLKNFSEQYGSKSQTKAVKKEDLTEKAKSLKSKIYYKKQMQSKDLHKMAKEVDMKNIFGHEMPGFWSDDTSDSESSEAKTEESVTKQQQQSDSSDSSDDSDYETNLKRAKTDPDNYNYKESVLYNYSDRKKRRKELLKSLRENPKLFNERFPGSNLSDISGYRFQ